MILGLLAGLLVVGAWATGHLGNSSAAAEFTLAPVEFGAMSETVIATGVVQPLGVVAVSSQLGGQVVEIYPDAEVNKQVREGQSLVRLDDRAARQKLDHAGILLRQAQTDVQRATAGREVAKTDLQRARDLRESKLAGDNDVKKAQAQLQAAEATFEASKDKVSEAEVGKRAAQLNLDLMVIRVPGKNDLPAGSTAGEPIYTIMERKVIVGQMVGPTLTTPLFTLARNLHRMQVQAMVSEDDMGKVRLDMPASFTVYAYPEDEVRFTGKVVEIRPMPSRVQGLVFYEALIDVANDQDATNSKFRLYPGMTASVTLVRRTHPHAWKMPSVALEFSPSDHQQTAAAKAKLAKWQKRPDAADWKSVWVLDEQKHPWPIFIRTGGKNPEGETGITANEFTEVLEWDPELQPRPDPSNRATYPHVITGSPPASTSSWQDKLKVKLF
jgi:HlyD family secretion protein